MKPESQKALPGNAVKVWAFLGGFLSFCCFLTPKETPWWFLHQNASFPIAEDLARLSFPSWGTLGHLPLVASSHRFGPGLARR